jgi:hypothetical protein
MSQVALLVGRVESRLVSSPTAPIAQKPSYLDLLLLLNSHLVGAISSLPVMKMMF